MHLTPSEAYRPEMHTDLHISGNLSRVTTHYNLIESILIACDWSAGGENYSCAGVWTACLGWHAACACLC